MSRPRLKIAFVVDRFGNRYGGAEAYGVELMRVLAVQHDITVFAREYDPACDLRLAFVPLRTWQVLPSWMRVLIFAWRARNATRHGYDIVHSHMNGYSGDIEVVHVTPVRYRWRVRSLPWLKRVMSYPSLRVQTYLRLEARRVASRQAHRTVAVSELISEQLKQAYGMNHAYPIIPPGVSKPSPTDASQRNATRSDLGLADDDCVCLLVARNPMRKGLPTVLKVLAQLPSTYKLLVVGSNATTRNFIYKSAAHSKLSDRIRLVNETADVSPYYRAADIYVHPTLNDSFGMAPLEAMSFGLPVILSPKSCCGFAQYVSDGRDAVVLSHPENDKELAEAILRINSDAAWRNELLRGAAQVVQRHSWTEVASQYLILYDAVLDERTAGSVPAAALR